jgi:hypothetical protein
MKRSGMCREAWSAWCLLVDNVKDTISHEHHVIVARRASTS